MSVAGGLGIGRMAIWGAATLIAGPAGWAVGGAVSGAVLAGMLYRNYQQNETQLRTHMSNWVAQAVGDARGAVARDLDRLAQAVQHHIEASLPARFAALSEQRKQVIAAQNTRRTAVRADPAVLTQLQEISRAAATADAVAATLLSIAPGSQIDPRHASEPAPSATGRTAP